jgi:hypothetical protein
MIPKMKIRPSIDPKKSRLATPGMLPAFLFAFALSCVPFSALAQEQADPLPEKVDSLLKKMSDHLAQAETFALEADILFDEVLDSGLLVQRAAKLKLLAQRPNGLRAHYKSDTEERTIWYDGKTVNVVDLDDQVHVEVPVPDKIGSAMDHLMDHYGISIPLSDFLFENPYEALTASVSQAFYIGMSHVNDVACHHLVFSQDSVDWQLWIEAGARPVPRKLVIVYKNSVGKPHYTATLTGVKLKSALPEDVFKPVIPDGVVTMDVLDLAPKVNPK